MKTIRTVWLAAVLAGLAVAQGPAAGGMDKVKHLEQQFQELQAKLQKDFAGLEQLPESEREAAGDRIYSGFQASAEVLVDQVLAIAAADHAEVGLAAAGAALKMNMTKAQRASLVETLSEHHATGNGIIDLVPSLRRVGGKTVDALLQKILAENPAKAAKGSALFVLAQRANEDAREALFEQCVADYADVEVGGQKLGAMAAAKLYAFRNIRVGGTPPDIVGQDMDGAAFKLSDYRGKVVVLDFWGFW